MNKTCRRCGEKLGVVPYIEELRKPKTTSKGVAKALYETWETGESGLDRYQCRKCETKYLDFKGNLVRCRK